MSDRMTEIVSGIGQTNTAPVTPYEAIIDNTVTAVGQNLFVIIPSLDGGRSTKGPLRWAPLPGPSGQMVFPTKGDLAQVVRTNEGYYWLTQFVPTVYPADTNVIPRITELEYWRQSQHGWGRYYAPALTTTVNGGWSWSPVTLTGISPDTNHFQVVTPGGTPGGVAAISNSGIKIKVPGMYKVDASLLQYNSASLSGRVDTYLMVLNSTGTVLYSMDFALINLPAGTTHWKAKLSFEFPLPLNSIVWPQNAHGQAYGDNSGAFSNLTLRYLGT
jgi:hypothetical protein